MRVPFMCILLLAAAFSGLEATTVERLSFGRIVAGAEAIIHGKVVRARTAWDAERTTIWTHYDIQVKSTLKGRPGAILTVSEPGGEIDGKHMQVVGAPRYQVGDEVVVFAAPTATGLLRTCGWGQGKFEVKASLASPSGRAVRAGAGNVTLVDPANRADEKAVPAAAFDGADLATFLDRIRSEVLAQQARGGK